MPDAVSGVSSAGAAYTPAAATVDRPDQMGKDVFMKLLVAQMRYQDPSNPVDSSQMMSQTATFTQVEKLEELAKQNAALLALQRSTSAGALVGRTVTYTDATGASASGVVTSVRLGTGTSEAVAMIGTKAVEMGRITEISQPKSA
ncbi:flagellar hook assembly protein FlgD [Geodermatophilus ruber]|uniref:Flagellar basal-body rod modification protein FlgD n=1 Tax=Geodermatophilus ruber TaxID=504800 RepID=A0A1I4G181_9ACTN|nr:flagellar hook capping FlgD N-terminal domain-containing protein [Geodermatophilus ruber]SFL22967.1 flagellar basal-body rod modification protein FlgD [Geodermatophilus ruber]